MATDIQAISMRRHFGGIATKRRYGSSTVTTFWVWAKGDPDRLAPGHYVEVNAYGRTPGERKTYAMNHARPILIARGYLPEPNLT